MISETQKAETRTREKRPEGYDRGGEEGSLEEQGVVVVDKIGEV